MAFSPATVEAIGSYVYALTDENERIFYIGQGIGNRVFDHVEEVKRLVEKDPDGVLAMPDNDDLASEAIPPKRQQIASILRKEQLPGMYIIREGLTQEQALLIEATLISVVDWQLDGALTNLVRGHGTAHYGLKSVDELEATKGEPFRIAGLPNLGNCREVVAINVNRRWSEVCTGTAELLEISKGRWRLSKARATNCPYAVIHANGIVRGVFEIRQWIGPDEEGRCTFEPVNPHPLLGQQFSNKNASSLFGNSGGGSQNPIRYVPVPR